MRNTCRSGRGSLRFGLNGVSRGVRRRADVPVGKSAHERIRVWGIGPACVKLSNGHTCKRPGYTTKCVAFGGWVWLVPWIGVWACVVVEVLPGDGFSPLG